MNGGLSQLTIYGTPTGANKRKHKGQTFRKSDYFNAATARILQVQAAEAIKGGHRNANFLFSSA
jgi:hypothetical protein